MEHFSFSLVYGAALNKVTKCSLGGGGGQYSLTEHVQYLTKKIKQMIVFPIINELYVIL